MKNLLGHARVFCSCNLSLCVFVYNSLGLLCLFKKKNPHSDYFGGKPAFTLPYFPKQLYLVIRWRHSSHQVRRTGLWMTPSRPSREEKPLNCVESEWHWPQSQHSVFPIPAHNRFQLQRSSSQLFFSFSGQVVGCFKIMGVIYMVESINDYIH